MFNSTNTVVYFDGNDGNLCLRAMYFVCFYDPSFVFWNYSDSVVLLVVYSIFVYNP